MKLIHTLILLCLVCSAAYAQRQRPGPSSSPPIKLAEKFSYSTALRAIQDEPFDNSGSRSLAAPDDYVVTCSGIDDTASLSAAITAASGGWVVIQYGSTCASSDLTIPNLRVFKGGLLKPLTGHTVVLENFEAGQYRTFINAYSGQGTVLLHTAPVTADGKTGVGQAYPQWWGAVADYTSDCAPALQAALNSGARRIFLPGGGYGLASTVAIRSNNFVLEGDSRVFTDIIPLAADIHVGSGPNAMFINAQKTCSPALDEICLPTNSIIEKVRFTSYIAFNGWAIWAEDGVQGGACLFSTTIRDCWVSMGISAPGFFHGGLSDCLIDNLEVENTGFVFHLQGKRMGGTTFSNIHVARIAEPLIYSVTDTSNMMQVHGLIITSQLQETLIVVKGGTDWIIDDVSLDYESGGNVQGGLAQFDNCTRLVFSNFTARRLSGNMSGILLKDTTGKVQNGYIYDPWPTTAIPSAITVSGASDLDIVNVNVEGGTVPALGLSGSGNVRVAHSKFNKSASVAVVSPVVGSLNLTIRDSEIMNSNYNVGSVLPIFDVATSGRFICVNNTIGVDDGLAVPTAYFTLTGSGDTLVDGNTFVGGLNLTTPGSTQLLKLGRNYGLASTFYAATMPTTGSWKQGDLVHALLTTQAGTSPHKYVLAGWIRLTTGSGNVANIDWVEMQIPTGN